jgi:hypothetical protein
MNLNHDALMNQTFANIDSATLLDMHAERAAAALHCHKPGTIESFNPERQTASVRINHKAKWNGLTVDYPLLVDVPVFVHSGGTASLTMPVKPGDTCLILFSDRDIDAWFSTGATDAVPPSQRIHSIADGFALVGFRSAANPVAGYHPDDAELRNNGAVVAVNQLVSIRTENENLGELLSDLIDSLTSWVDTNPETKGDKPNGDTISALKAIKSRIPNLLK